ncbi:alpha/beta hydrolase [Nakamurella leprariae]|uniref:Esterase n=1 Tax=Nakamurella leprariae TaxID=2803911 RepID=A0A938YH55_9ACTN|nr:alpha/beta hydrolase-fold protein [Nakamurella leprariae]MBM9467720.1 hypothetical protein [Nakamurella leprariae]
MSDLSLISGWVPWMLSGLAAVAFLALLVSRSDRRWWRVLVPSILVGAMVVSLLLDWIVDDLWQPFPEPLPIEVTVWVAVIIAGIGLTVAAMFRTRWWRKVVAVISGLVVLAAGANLINIHFAQFPTVGTLFGEVGAAEIDLPTGDGMGPRTNPPGPLSGTWRAEGPLPAGGSVSEVTIPATISGWTPRPGYVYLPPAYFASNRPALPVLMMIHGQPGGPRDLLTAGQLAGIMDAFASQHGGLAPLVVMPDALGSDLDNPICADTSAGKVDTYLSQDVPAWIEQNLSYDGDTAHWAVGGFSYGGTCAIQLATKHPQLFSSFLDASGQAEPTLGSRQETVDKLYGGDEQAFLAANPQTLLQDHRYPDSAGQFWVGANDAEYGPQAQAMYQAAQAAGMDVTIHLVDGSGHDWNVPVTALRDGMPWLAGRMGIIPS